MGIGGSKEAYVSGCGTEADYNSSFEEIKVIGEGEFGVVKLVVKERAPVSEPYAYAVKVLNKGYEFKDNVLYNPMNPEELNMEISILRLLNGKKFNLVLDSVYESPSKLYLVTEICFGGDMLEYTREIMTDGLRTEDVSRIAYQLLSAIDHCDRHNITHRDIKPENVMFKEKTKTSELRLIDFGCATLDSDEEKGKEHATFAGTAFYNSPEMFQKRYTSKTDVFSAGVVLYVLVAGYPAERLQEAFNLLQKVNRDLKTLPGMPKGMPETYYGMLYKMLTYHWKRRKSAGDLMEDEFLLFHQSIHDKGRRISMRRSQSLVLLGTDEKATSSLGFVNFLMTAILATMLDKGDILSLISHAESKASAYDELDIELRVIKVKDVKSILEKMGESECVAIIERQNNEQAYDNYLYEYNLLKPFAKNSFLKHGSSNDQYFSTRRIEIFNRGHQSCLNLKDLKGPGG